MTEPTYDKRHGGPYDRGAADSYYGRGFTPHYYKAGTMTSERVELKDMTQDEIDAYNAGFDDNERAGDHKDWG